MKKAIFLLLTAVLMTSCAVSKRVTDLPIPTAFIPVEEVDVAAYEEKYGEYDGVYLESEYILEHTGVPAGSLAISPWAFYRVLKNRYVVFNPDDEDLSTFNITTHASAKLSKIYLRITYPNREVKQFDINDLHSEKASKYQITYKFAYPNVTRGTIIEEGYELSYKVPLVYPPLEHEIYLQYRIPCEKLNFSYAYPDWWTIQAKRIAENVSIDVELTKDPENRKNTITYSAENIPAYKMESYAPAFKELGKYYQFQVTNMNMQAVKYTAPISWQEAAKGFKRYATKKDGIFSSKVLDMTNKLIKEVDDPIERLDAIITYLQENIEISYDDKNRNFKNILKDKQGDTYRITGLAQSMLLKAGIDAKYLLLHSAEDGYFDRDYITPAQFSQPAIGVKLEDRTYVLFPYLKTPIGYVPEHLQGQQAITITLGEGSNYSVDFWDVPVETITQNRIEESYKLTIDKEGFIHVEEDKVFSGYYSYKLRESLQDLREDEQKEAVEELLTYDEGIVELTSFEIINLEAYKKPLRVRLEYNIDNLVTVLPDEVIFQTGGLFSPASGVKYKIDTDKRYNPIKILYDEVFNKRITIHFPVSWTPTTILKDVNVENIFGSIEGKYKVEEGKITVSQNRNLKKSYEPKEKILELQEIAGTQSKLFIPSIIFRYK